jgi:thiol reductant ABC exporter CydD subunit
VKFIDPRLFQSSRSSRGLIILAVTTAFAITLTTLLQAFLLADLITSAFQQERALESMKATLFLLILVMALRVTFGYLSERSTSRISHSIRVELRQSLFNKILAHGSELNVKFGPARLSLISTRAIANLEPYFTRFIPQIFIAVLIPVVVGVTIAYLDLTSGLIALLTVPLIPFFGALIGKFTSEAMQKRWQTLGLLSGYVLDLLSGLTTLRLYGRHKVQEEKLTSVGNRYRIETMRVLKISFLTSLALELIATLSVALIAVFIGLRLVDGEIELWRGLTVLILAPEVYWPIRNLSAQFHASTAGIESAHDIYEILDYDTPVRRGRTNVRRTREISWEKLTFDYPDREPIEIASGSAKSGGITAITGSSGSGKTTLINILLGLISPSSGRAWVKTNNSIFQLSEIDHHHWLSLISWVPQDPAFPTGSVMDYFRLSSPSITAREVTEALTRVGLHEIEIERPIELSLGQKRRLAIARALLRPHEILIMDEPSASLDQESELIVFNLLKSHATSGKIVIVVSHSPVLINLADEYMQLEMATK